MDRKRLSSESAKMHRRLNRRGTEERERDAGSTQGAFKISSTSVLFLSLASEGIRILSAYEIPRSPFCRPYSFRNTKGGCHVRTKAENSDSAFVEYHGRNLRTFSAPINLPILATSNSVLILRLSSASLRFITSREFQSVMESDGALAPK